MFSVLASLVFVTMLLISFASIHGTTRTHKVHIVFSCHLDVGFDGIDPEPGLDSTVINKYFHEYFPNAIKVAQNLTKRGGPERLVFLTHAWLVRLYFHCPPQIGIKCPADTEPLREAIQRGDITWHAFPHNAQVELLDQDLLQFAASATHDLDREFGLPYKVTMSQRDVPGLTRAAIPILASQGVGALSVGVNGGSAPPGVPKNTPFWWRDEPSGRALLAFWHPGGYSGEPVDGKDECVQVEGYDRALCMSWKGDNAGPPSVEEVLEVFRRVQQNFPGAVVVASGFDEFVVPLLELAPTLDLPVVIGELGDTWIHGVGSDPGRLAEYKALLRVRKATRELWDDPPYIAFGWLLLKVAEHTWGIDIKKGLADYDNWTNKQFHAQLAQMPENYRVTLESWERQRAWGRWALQELGSSPSAAAFQSELDRHAARQEPPSPSEPLFTRADLARPLRFRSPSWEIEMDRTSGAIIGLWRSSSQVTPPGVLQGQALGEPCEAGRCGAGDRTGTHMAGAVTAGEFPSGAETGCAGSRHGTGRGKNRWWAALAWLGRAAVWRGRRGAYMEVVEGGSGAAQRVAEEETRVRHDQEGVGLGGCTTSYASREHPLAQIVYSLYAEDDYSVFWEDYAYMNNRAEWFYKDFGKPNSTVKGGARRADVFPLVEGVWHRQQEDGGLHLVVKSRFPTAVVEDAGAPRAIWTEIKSLPGSQDLLVDVVWENKTATRLPETLWLRWRPDPSAVNPQSWVMWKLGQPISPMEVVVNGSHSLHAVGDEGVSVHSAAGQGDTVLSIRSFDAALVSPGSPTPFPNLRTPPDLTQGMAFALTNNIWGTNYPMWCPYRQGDRTMRFRFLVQTRGRGVLSHGEGAVGAATWGQGQGAGGLERLHGGGGAVGAGPGAGGLVQDA